jgi:general secretion pathway protein A
VAKVLASVPKDKVQTSIVFHPTLSSSDFLELVLLDFGVRDIPPSKAQRLTLLQSFLLESHKQGKISTLIVDEAQKLSGRLLEEIRLLGNFDRDGQKLLQILLVGQTELDDVLALEHLRQLKQRIAIRLQIGPLAQNEVDAYIRYRWLRAGGSEPIPFTPEAVDSIARASRGLPRVINAACDNALLLAFADGSHTVAISHARQSITDLKLLVPTIPANSTAAAKNGIMHAPLVQPASGSGVTSESPIHEDELVRRDVVPGPVRVPDFELTGQRRSSFFGRLAGKFIGNT